MTNNLNAESKHEKFTRLAEARVNAILDKMRTLAKLANKNNYSWTKDEASHMISTLRKEVDMLEEAFTSKGESQVVFRFKKD